MILSQTTLRMFARITPDCVILDTILGKVNLGVGKWDREGKGDNTGHVKKQVPRVGNWNSIWLGTAGTLHGDCLWVTHLRRGEDGNLFTNSLSLLLRTCSKVLQLFSNSVLLACGACSYIQRSLVSSSERNH